MFWGGGSFWCLDLKILSHGQLVWNRGSVRHIAALLLYLGVIFRLYRMSALGSQTPSKAACEESCCNLSFSNGRNEVRTETFKLPGVVTDFSYFSWENLRVVVEASVLLC